MYYLAEIEVYSLRNLLQKDTAQQWQEVWTERRQSPILFYIV